MTRNRIHKLSKYIWPQRLRYQLALIFVAIISTAIATFSLHLSDEEAKTLTQELQKHTAVLAENIANASAQYLLVRDYTSIENILIGAAKFPGIMHIEITDMRGKIIGAVEKDINQRINPKYGVQALTTPENQGQSIIINGHEMLIWQPINLSSTIGWVRISYDLKPIEIMAENIWNDNLREGGLIVIITFFLIIIFLHRPTLSLSRYTDFADQLNQNLGQQVEIDNHAIEFTRLGSALNHASKRLKQQDDELNTLLADLRRVAVMAEYSPNIVFSMNQDGEIIYANHKANLLMSQHQLSRNDLTRILPKDFDSIRQNCFAEGILKKDTESYFNNTTYLWTFSPFHEQNLLHCYAVDISERKKAQEELVRQANIDPLTGLPNRNLALDRLELAITRAHREQHLVCVMFIDLDRFKTVNDSFGHSIGDKLLMEVAKQILRCVREGDTVARLGGDEFLVILDGIEKAINSELYAEHILEVLNRPFHLDNNEFFVGASIGIAIYPDDGVAPLVLLRNSDSAMYQAKDNGRGGFRFFTQALNDEAVLRVKMESCLRHAIENNELHLEYQPQICAKTGLLHGVEALVRWNNPELNIVPPTTFIPLAEDTGLICEIGEWILKTACQDLSGWMKLFPSSLSVAVNMSSRQFRSETLIQTIKQTLTDTGILATQLELEITEGLLLDDSPRTLGMLNELKTMNISLALDDFGTGYSSLSYLKRYPFDILKIDQSFVRDISTDPGDAAVCQTIIAIASKLGMKVVGEGVETDEQLSFLAKNGVDIIQGYYYSKPLNAEDFSNYLEAAEA